MSDDDVLTAMSNFATLHCEAIALQYARGEYGDKVAEPGYKRWVTLAQRMRELMQKLRPKRRGRRRKAR